MEVSALASVKSWILTAITRNIDPYGYVIEKIRDEKPIVNNVADLKKHSKLYTGKLFEAYCKLYLEYNGYQVWWIHELSEEQMIFYGFKTRKDDGIDLIASKDNQHYAVQCKFRGKATDGVRWKELSTFLGLARTTGPAKIGWTKYITMTSGSHVNHPNGKKDPKELSKCKGTISKVDSWADFINMKGNTLSDETPKQLTAEEMRNRRAAYFS